MNPRPISECAPTGPKLANRVALITGGLALLGVIITNSKNQTKIDAKLDKQQAVTDTKLQALTDEVKEHNKFARRMPVVEEQIKSLNHRVKDLEEYHK